MKHKRFDFKPEIFDPIAEIKSNSIDQELNFVNKLNLNYYDATVLR